MISIAALAPAPHSCSAVAADSRAASSSARFLLCTLPALPAHLVGVPAVVTHHLKALIRNVLRDCRDEITCAEHMKVALDLLIHSVQRTIALGHSFAAITAGGVNGEEPQIFLPPAVAKLAKGFWRMFAKKPKSFADDLKLPLKHRSITSP